MKSFCNLNNAMTLTVDSPMIYNLTFFFKTQRWGLEDRGKLSLRDTTRAGVLIGAFRKLGSIQDSQQCVIGSPEHIRGKEVQDIECHPDDCSQKRWAFVSILCGSQEGPCAAAPPRLQPLVSAWGPGYME